jgi:hypothetical protein
MTVFCIASPAAVAQWKYETTKDALADVGRTVATLSSPTKFQLGFPYQGGTTGWLNLRQKDNGNGQFTQAVFFISRGQIVEDDSIVIRFDDAETVSFDTAGASDGSTRHAFLRFPGVIVGCTPQEVGRSEPRRVDLVAPELQGRLAEAAPAGVATDSKRAADTAVSALSASNQRVADYQRQWAEDDKRRADESRRRMEADREWSARQQQAQAACIMTGAQFTQRLAGAARARVQVTLYDNGRRVFEFKPAGLRWQD